jgi:hypothetical protein
MAIITIMAIMAIMAIATVFIVVVIISVRKYSAKIIGIFQEDIVIIVLYEVCTKSLAEEPIIGLNIDQCFNLLHPQAVLSFAMHKKIHAPILFA